LRIREDRHKTVENVHDLADEDEADQTVDEADHNDNGDGSAQMTTTPELGG